MYSQNECSELWSDFSSDSKNKFKYEDFVDSLKLNDLEDNFEHASTPPPEVIDKCLELGDDDFWDLKLPELSSYQNAPNYGDQSGPNYGDQSGLNYGDQSRPNYDTQSGPNYGFSVEPVQYTYLPCDNGITNQPSLNSQFSSFCNIGDTDILQNESNGLGETIQASTSNWHTPDKTGTFLPTETIGLETGTYASTSSWDYMPDKIGGQYSQASNSNSSYDMQTNRHHSSDSSPLSVSSYSNSFSPMSPPVGLPPATSKTTKQSRKKNSVKNSLAQLSEEEKYLRIRDQNNVASREYRDRQKNKKKSVQEKLKDILTQNEHFKKCEKDLECQYKQCIAIKNTLEKLGYNFSELNLT